MTPGDNAAANRPPARQCRVRRVARLARIDIVAHAAALRGGTRGARSVTSVLPGISRLTPPAAGPTSHGTQNQRHTGSDWRGPVMAVDEAVRHTALLPGGIAPDARDADPRGIHLARAWGLDKTDIDGNRFLAATHAAADVTEAIAGWREPIRRLRAKGALPAARGQ